MNNDNSFPIAPPEVFVFNVRPSPKEGPTVAFADVKIGSVTIHGVSVVKNKWEGFFVGFPVKFGTTGRTFPLVDVDEPDRAEVIRMVLDAAKQFTTARN